MSGDKSFTEVATMPTTLWKNEFRATVKLALPLIGTQISTIAIGTTDVLMLGRYSHTALAAVSIGVSYYITVWLFCLGVILATSPLMAQAVGGRNEKDIRRTFRQGVWVLLTVFIPAAIVNWYAQDILHFFGQEDHLAEAAGHYIRIITFGIPGSLGFILLRSLISAYSRPKAALVVNIIGVLANILFDYALIFGKFGMPELGLQGSAYASFTVYWLMFGMLLAFILLDPQFAPLRLLKRFWVPDWEKYFHILRIGLPIGLTLLMESGFFLAVVLIIGLLGEKVLAANSIAMQCVNIAFMIPLGIAQAATVRVGLAVGEKNPQAVSRAGWSALIFGAIAAILTCLALVLFAHPIVTLFIDANEPENFEIIRMATTLLVVASVFHFSDAAQVIGLSVLRGMNDTKFPMVFAMLGYWVLGISAAWLLAFGFDQDAVGAWLGLSVGLTFVAVMCIYRFHKRDRYGLMEKA